MWYTISGVGLVLLAGVLLLGIAAEWHWYRAKQILTSGVLPVVVAVLIVVSIIGGVMLIGRGIVGPEFFEEATE